MPANLTPQYIEAEQRYRKAATPEEKLRYLKEMIKLVPKHKGTERLRVDLKKRLKQLQQEIQKKPKATRSQPWEHIEREGAGQIALVGLPNVGKSSLLAAVTNAKPEIAEYPFSTFRPSVGMMPFEDIQIQLVDLPPLSDFTEGYVFNLIRQADAAALLVDLSGSDPGEAVLEALSRLEERKIQLTREGGLIEDSTKTIVRVKTIMMATKRDAEGSDGKLAELRELYGGDYKIVAISTATGEGIEEMKRAFFELLGIVRVYTKKPGRPASKEAPYVLPKGSTIVEATKAVHHELAEKIKYARIWGSSEFPGQRVERDHVVQDGDIIEIHA
jgi:hypothetical protein